MSRLGVTFTQDVGDQLTVVPMDGRYLISLGRRNAEGGVFLELPEAQAAVLLSKLTVALVSTAPKPKPVLDDGVVTLSEAGLGALAMIRAGITSQGGELTAPSLAPDDFGPREPSDPSIADLLQGLRDGEDPDVIRSRLGLPLMGEGQCTAGDVESWLHRNMLSAAAAPVEQDFGANVHRLPLRPRR